ncbi:MAG: carbohydrate ABC transporter permease [Candidatus Izemoplasmatales bacterium]
MTTNRKAKFRRLMLGRRGNDGLLFKIVMYVLLVGISFIFLYPLLSMLSMSVMSLEDLIDATIAWIPRNLTLANYATAFSWMNFGEALKASLQVSVYPTLATVVSSALIGYGFAHFRFFGRKALMALMVAMFLIPSVLTYIPTTVLYNDLSVFGIPLNLTESIRAFTIPAMLGNGIRQTIFILIFYQFFRIIPSELYEAAAVDGSGVVRTFLTIAVPMAAPAFLICGLYSFVWYWNETALARAYFGNTYTTLPMALEAYINTYRSLYAQGQVNLDSVSSTYNLGVQYAMTLITIVPLLVVYLFLQKWFVEGVDRSGIAGN